MNSKDSIKIIESISTQIARFEAGDDPEDIYKKIEGLGKAAIRTHKRNPAVPELVEALSTECKKYIEGTSSLEKIKSCYTSLKSATS